jgi:hypothetical protein
MTAGNIEPDGQGSRFRTDSTDTILIEEEGREDTTVRPCRPSLRAALEKSAQAYSTRPDPSSGEKK